MNTATHHRTGTALAAVLVAFVLPLAACQTPRPAQDPQDGNSSHVAHSAGGPGSSAIADRDRELSTEQTPRQGYVYEGYAPDRLPIPTAPLNEPRRGPAKAF